MYGADMITSKTGGLPGQPAAMEDDVMQPPLSIPLPPDAPIAGTIVQLDGHAVQVVLCGKDPLK